MATIEIVYRDDDTEVRAEKEVKVACGVMGCYDPVAKVCGEMAWQICMELKEKSPSE